MPLCCQPFATQCRTCAGFNTRQQRNCICYMFEMVITSPLFFVLAAEAPFLLTAQPQTVISVRSALSIMYSSTAIVLLYVFELLYRLDTNIWLMVHHLATILTVALSALALVATLSVNVVLLETLLFSALSEQITFVALLMHRFKVRGASLAFKAAAVQSYVCKGVVFCLCWVVYARVFYNGLAVVPGASAPAVSDWSAFLKYFVPIVNTVLAVTQASAELLVYFNVGDRLCA
eukprot:8742-Heterococcus_DN1.PRE.2